ncbi:OmpW family outer membrane protein [Luteimonas sp. MC1825]|uniref:OmpW/AlkL family protein n=1 Tax=Luteimonas sp. MC1825 TaxID=2761107 RepID=UPI00160E7A0B|nr:OmpW family outer membrane protein [Luteimonas sp. MC1825]MBB6598297.1 OmpW family protein [Luteimonas sp. MC1825]QOC88508.1 OmpW family protein [Luteimonas sp. MC1825]
MSPKQTISRITRLVLPAALALAILPSAAFAADGAGKHVSVVGGYSMVEPTRNPEIAGARTEFAGEGTPTLGVTWHATDNIGIEAWGADSYGQRVTSGGQKVGSVDAQPYSLSGQYRFGTVESTVRPFVGLGYHQTNYNNESATLAGDRVGVETAEGGVATVGMDVNISPTWFARADARYFQSDSEVKIDGVKAGDAKLDPVVVGVGIGARF